MLNTIEKKKDLLIVLAFFVVSLLVLSIKLGDMTFGTGDEYYYFQSSKNMVSSGEILKPTYDGEIRFQKPILTYWGICSFFSILGVSWFTARLYSAVLASFGIALTFLFGCKIFDRKTLILAAIVLFSSEVYFVFARTVTTDMPFLFFLTIALYSFWMASTQTEKSNRFVILFYAGAALATLTKGVQGVVLPAAVVVFFILATQKWYMIKKLFSLKGILLFVVLTAPWFIYSWFLGRDTYVEQVVEKEFMGRLLSTGYKIRPFYYLQYLFIRFLPWSLFLIGALFAYFRRWRNLNREERAKHIFCLAWIVAILAAYTLITSKHKHYLLQIAPPIALIVGSFFSYTSGDEIAQRRLSFKLPFYLTVIVSLLGSLLLALFIVFVHPPEMFLLFIQSLILLIIPIGLFFYKKHPTAFPVITGIVSVATLAFFINVSYPVVSPPVADKFVKTIKEQTHDGRPYDIVIGTYGISRQRFSLLLGRPIEEIVDFVPWNHAEKLTLFYNKDGLIFFPVSEWDLELMKPYFKKYGLDPDKFHIIDSITIWNSHMISEDPDTAPPKITPSFIKDRLIDIFRWDRERFLRETQSNIYLVTNDYDLEEYND